MHSHIHAHTCTHALTHTRAHAAVRCVWGGGGFCSLVEVANGGCGEGSALMRTHALKHTHTYVLTLQCGVCEEAAFALPVEMTN